MVIDNILQRPLFLFGGIRLKRHLIESNNNIHFKDRFHSQHVSDKILTYAFAYAHTLMQIKSCKTLLF